MKKIAIACDHAGFELKEYLKQQLADEYQITDYGTNGTTSVDYPDFVHPAATSVENANKHQKIRCALAWMPELGALARQHNNCNMVALPARFIAKELALDIAKVFLTTEFEGGRHQNRVDKICL